MSQQTTATANKSNNNDGHQQTQIPLKVWLVSGAVGIGLFDLAYVYYNITQHGTT